MDRLLEFSQASSELRQTFFPPLPLNEQSTYVLGLYCLSTYNSIPNILENVNNRIAFVKESEQPAPSQAASHTIKLPQGDYQVSQLEAYIKNRLGAAVKFNLAYDEKLKKLVLSSDYTLEITEKGCLQQLGFAKQTVASGTSVFSNQMNAAPTIKIVLGKNDELVVTPPAPPPPQKQLVVLQVPTGSYELKELKIYLEELAKAYGVNFTLTLNPSTMKLQMTSDHEIYFPEENSLRTVLGFLDTSYAPNVVHISERVPQISSINIINVECNLTSGSFRNGKKSHCLYSFASTVATGYKLIERPQHILFFPVHGREISTIIFRLTDQQGNLIHFNNEEITIHLILRELKKA